MRSEKNVMSENKHDDNEISREDSNENGKSGSKQISVYHLKGREYCLAWKIRDLGAFTAWKNQQVPLSAKNILLPPDWRNPGVCSQVACGTCGTTRLNPVEMIYEIDGKRLL